MQLNQFAKILIIFIAVLGLYFVYSSVNAAFIAPTVTLCTGGGCPQTPPGGTIVWTSSNASIAGVNQSGRVTAVAAGAATVTAFFDPDGTGPIAPFSATATVNVTAAPPPSIVGCPGGSVNTGQIISLSASGGTAPYSWSAPTGTPPSGSGSSFSVSYSTAGSKTITLTDANSRTATCNVNVVAPADFTLTLSPLTQTISQGGSTTFSAFASCSGGFTGPVTTLTVNNLHPGATPSFSPASISCGGSTTLTISTTLATTTGTRSIFVSGTGSGIGSRTSNTASLTVSPLSPPPPPLPGPAPNPANATCEQLTVSWIDVSGETGYHVWRNTTGGTNLGAYTQVGGARPTDSTSYTETVPPLVAGTSYFYIVTSFNAAGDSAVGPGWPVGPTIVNPCVADLSGSRKIVYQVNGNDYTGQTIRNGDLITFRIIIENAGTVTAYDLYIEDTVTDNLDYQPGSVRLNGSRVSENIQGNTITWDWPARNLGDKPATGPNWILSLDARVNSNSPFAVDFVENKGRIYYDRTEANDSDNQSVPFSTGIVPIRTGQTLVPVIREVTP